MAMLVHIYVNVSVVVVVVVVVVSVNGNYNWLFAYILVRLIEMDLIVLGFTIKFILSMCLAKISMLLVAGTIWRECGELCDRAGSLWGSIMGINTVIVYVYV